MKATATCTTCGGELAGGASPLGNLCPACVIRASCTPETSTDGSLTTWAEVFPQLEVERILREEAGVSVYLAAVVGEGDARKAVLQVASGKRFAEAGGVAALTTRAQRLSTCEIEGLAPVLDFGDLADAFFLVTEAPGLPSLPEALEGKDAAALSLLVRAVTEETEAIIQAARAAGVSLRADPDLCFVEEETGRVVLTPGLLPGEVEPSADAPMITKLAAGDQLGAFRLEEMVGEGGFGKVWRARQERPVERMVAVKVLKSGLHSQRARARFEVEQQALAKLDHPHIARFFDGGTTFDGRPYFAMEWIDGPSLTPYVKKGDAPLAERLRLFRQVCEAVHHAHQKGIIHRDLKSSNVMVCANSDQPAAKVIDFGIARAVEDPLVAQTQLTRAEEILGTPAAMSPEQAAGAGGSELDARTDVYGLGILLYELLGGELPFDPKLPADELRRQIREEDPPKPSSRIVEPVMAKAVRGDLDWITRRCLEKDPERRYRSVSALMRDLERHAAHQPVEAGPPEVAYRAKKFVRRNRAVVAGSVVALVALVVGLVLALDGYRQANLRTIEAQDARATAEAEANTSSEVTTFLKEHFFGQLNPGANPNSDLTLAEAVRHASEALDNEPLNAPEVEGEIRMTLAESLEGLGRYRDAEAHYRIAVDKLGSALGPEAAATINALASHAQVLSILGQHREACALQQRVVDYWSTRDGSDRRESLRSRRDLARFLIAAYRLRDGIEILAEVFEQQRNRYGIDHLETLESLAELSRFYGSEEKNFRRAAELRSDLDVASIYRDGSIDAIGTLHSVVELVVSDADCQVLGTRLNHLQGEKAVPRIDVLRLQLEYAKALYPRSPGDAIAQCEPILGELEATLGPSHPIVFDAYNLLTRALYKDGQRSKIPEYLDPVLARFDPKGHLPAEFERLASRYYGLFGRWKEAARFYHNAAPQLDLWQLDYAFAAAMAAGDRDALDALRTEMLDRFGDTDDPYAAAGIAEQLLDMSLLTDAVAPENLDRIVHYVAIAHAERPERGKTRVAATRLALAKGDFELASRLADEAAKSDQSKLDIFDRDWMAVAQTLSAAHLGDQSKAEILLRNMAADWKASHAQRLRWWPAFIPIAIALDQADALIRPREQSTSRLSPDRFGVSESAYKSATVAYERAYERALEADKIRREGNLDEALAINLEVLPVFDAALGVGAEISLLCRMNIMHLYQATERHREAIPIAKEIVRILEETRIPKDRDLLVQRYRLAYAFSFAGDYREAIGHLERLMPRIEVLAEEGLDLDLDWHATLETSFKALVDWYRKLDNSEMAEKIFARAAATFEWEVLGYPVDAGARVVTTVLVPPTSEWRWLHPLDGVDPAESDPNFHETFYMADFDDSQWRSGRDSEGPTGGFGYGDDGFTGVDIGTPTGEANAHGLRDGKAAYFRHRFKTEQAHTKLELRCQRDDGIIVYLDGAQVGRSNMSDGDEAYSLPAFSAVGGDKETTTYRIPLNFPNGDLPADEHILAISLHNPAKPSSDLRIGGITLVEVE